MDLGWIHTKKPHDPSVIEGKVIGIKKQIYFNVGWHETCATQCLQTVENHLHEKNSRKLKFTDFLRIKLWTYIYLINSFLD